MDPDRADRAARAHARVAGLRARHAGPPAARRRRRGSAGPGPRDGAPDGHQPSTPRSALLLLPPLLAVVVALHLSSRRRLGKGRRRAALVRPRPAPLAPRRRPGRAPAGAAGRPARGRVRRRPVGLRRHGRPRGRARLPARVAGREAGRGRRGDRGVRRPTRWWSGCPPTSPRSTASPRRRSATRPTSARRCASPGPCSPTTPRSGSCSCPTATTPRARGSPRRRWRRRAGSRSRPCLTGLGGRDEALVQRLTSPSTARLGESVDVSARRHLDRSPSRRPCACSSTASWPAPKPVDLDGRRQPGRRSSSRAKDAGFLRFRIVVEAARDTFNQNDRADANTIVKGEPKVLVVKGDEDVAAAARRRARDRAPGRGHGDPRGAPVGPRRPRGLRLDRARGRAPDPAHRQGAGGAPGLRPRPRAGPGDGRRAARATAPAATPTRRSRSRCRSTWASATARSSPTSRSSSSSTSRARWTPATATASTAGWAAAAGSGGTRKIDIGKEAILRAASALTAHRTSWASSRSTSTAHWVVQTAPLGGLRTSRRAIAASSPNGQTEHLRRARPGGEVAQGRDRDPAPHHPAHRRLVLERPVRRRSSSR